MNNIDGLTDSPKQQNSIILSDGTKVVWYLEYRPQQIGWFYDIAWNGNPVVNGQRLVCSPNILRQYINTIPFGIAVLRDGNVDPTGLEDLSDGSTQTILLEGADRTDIETLVYGAKAVTAQPVGTSGTGQTAIIPPESWGPAGGDLTGTYPNPRVVAMHEASGPTQLLLGAVPDGQFLKRVGGTIVGATVAGAGDVVGPGSAVNSNVALFNGTTGKIIKDGGTLGTAAFQPTSAFDAAGAAASAQSAAIAVSAQKTANLSDLSSPSTARTNLGLGTAATRNIPASGNAAATEVVLGNDTRLTGGGSGNVPTGGVKFARLAKNSATNYDTGWYGPDTFNVKDYGCVGDGSTNDTTNFQAAATAAASANGCLYVPQGVYKTTSAIAISLIGSMSIRGDGPEVSIILGATAAMDGITCDLSGGGVASNHIGIRGIGFRTTAATACGKAIKVSYGASNVVSWESGMGSVVSNIDINGFSSTDTSAGWTWGIYMENAWHSFVTDIYGYGNKTTYKAASVPGAGDNGAGSGALITQLSGVNYTIDRIQGDFWSQCIRLRPYSLSTAGQDQVAQGVLLSNWNIVECEEGLHVYKNNAGAGIDLLTVLNFQVDNGNLAGVTTHRGIIMEAAGNVFVSCGLILMNNGPACIELNPFCGFHRWSNVICQGFSVNPAYAVKLVTSTNIYFENCGNGGLPVDLGAGNLCQFGQYDSGTVTATGPGTFVIGNARGSCATIALSSAQSCASATPTLAALATTVYDDNGMAGSNKLTVPAGATRVRLTALAHWASSSVGYRYAFIRKNGATLIASNRQPAQDDTSITVSSQTLAVVPTDYFELVYDQGSGIALNVTDATLSIEVIR